VISIVGFNSKKEVTPMDPTVAIFLIVCVVIMVTVIGIVVSKNSRSLPSETPVQAKYHQLKQADEARNRVLASQRAIEEQNAQLEAVRARERIVKEAQSWFTCAHKDGCGYVTKRPPRVIEVQEWHGLVDDGEWWSVPHITPRDMFRCLTCNDWFCRKHIARKESSTTGYCYSCEVARMQGRT
jgi:hypothetical protein